MTHKSLEQKLAAAKSPVEMLRNAQTGPYAFPVPAQYTHWAEEQEAWRNSAVLLNQSFHMTDLYVQGRDCYRLLSDLGVNSFNGFGPMKAKQIVVCNPDGFVIGDSILFGIGENSVLIVGRPPTSNWIEYNATTGVYDVTIRRDERSPQNPDARETYRFQVQGPNAAKIFEIANGGPLPEIPFFHMGKLRIGAFEATVLNHRMSGFPGYELWGPFGDHDGVRDTLMEIGQAFGLKLGGSRAYSTVAIESGWIPSPTPAVYSGAAMKPYREWLGADSFEANLSLGGSFVSERIEDYYQTPWDLGYGFMVRFDHEFVGRSALEDMAGKPHRKKVWLYWVRDDVMRINGSMYSATERCKIMEIPAAHYATCPFDRVLKDGRTIGVSTYPVYSSNVRGWISLAMIDEDEAVYGDEVTLIWGEPDGGSGKPGVEPHVQTEVRAVIRPKPFAQART